MADEKIKHEDYQKDFAYGKNGIWYKNYFFPLKNLDSSEKEIKDQVVKCISGTETYLKNCVGFCCLKGFFLTEKQMKGHECRRKQCKRFLRAPYSEEYWKRQEEIKKMKKLKKAANKW